MYTQTYKKVTTKVGERLEQVVT